jgi:hypothetical protein
MVAAPIHGRPSRVASGTERHPTSEGGAVAEFEVESYTVATVQVDPGPPGASRTITLTSPALTHGIRTSASIYFLDSQHTTIGVVLNVDKLNYEGHRVLVRVGKDDFADWYDILRNEQPLKFRYRYDGEGSYDPDRPRRRLFTVRLYTGLPEPPGEGEDGLQALFTTDGLEQRRAAQPEAADGGGP